MFDAIAERDVICQRASGKYFPVTIRIGAPYRVEEGEWACPVSLTGLQEQLSDVHGVDSLQALLLAIGLARKLLGYIIDDGGRILWPDSDSPVDLDTLFADRPKR
ncbi:MAG TPA: hypothetical protein VGA00_04810 [Acidiferrobacterales bacterium]|jgi:hypothetical protein